MALILLTLLGSLVGWIGSILLRIETPGIIVRMMALGITGSLVAGLIANEGTFLGSLSWLGLAVALAAAILAIVVYFVFLNRDVQV